MTRIERIIRYIRLICVRFVISSLSRDLFFICPFLAHSAKPFLLRFFGAKKVAKKHSPIQGLPPGEGCKRESRTTDDSRAFLVSRDTRYSLLHPCLRRPLERDSQVRGGVFVGWRMVYPFNPNNPCSPLLRGPARNGYISRDDAWYKKL